MLFDACGFYRIGILFADWETGSGGQEKDATLFCLVGCSLLSVCWALGLWSGRPDLQT